MNSYALVTGSSDRIGKSIALQLAKMGYNLILHYNKSNRNVKSVKAEIENMGQKAQILKIDFLEQNNFDSILEKLKQEGVLLEVLINNSSIFAESTFKEAGSNLLLQHFKINFETPYLLTKAFVRYFDKGNIINLLDAKVEKEEATHLDYILSKKLLKEFTFISANNLGPNFRVNAIAPGLLLPPSGKTEEYLQSLVWRNPLKATGNLAQVQKTVQYILDNEFLTGQIIYIDGGEHL